MAKVSSRALRRRQAKERRRRDGKQLDAGGPARRADFISWSARNKR
jgi:hypothetical protein